MKELEILKLKVFFFGFTCCVSIITFLVMALWLASEGGPLAPEPFESEVSFMLSLVAFFGIWCVYLIVLFLVFVIRLVMRFLKRIYGSVPELHNDAHN